MTGTVIILGAGIADAFQQFSGRGRRGVIRDDSV